MLYADGRPPDREACDLGVVVVLLDPARRMTRAGVSPGRTCVPTSTIGHRPQSCHGDTTLLVEMFDALVVVRPGAR